MSAPTPYLPSLIVDNVITALGAFILPFLNGADASEPIVRGQQNRVAPPLGPYCLLQELMEADLSTPQITYSRANVQLGIESPTKIDVQVDLYGPNAGDWAKAIKGVYRTYYATSQFPDGIVPLYCTDAREFPLVTGEDQYEYHWGFTACLEYNPCVFVPQLAAKELKINIIEAIP